MTAVLSAWHTATEPRIIPEHASKRHVPFDKVDDSIHVDRDVARIVFPSTPVTLVPALVPVSKERAAVEDDVEIERRVAVVTIPHTPGVVLETAITSAVVILVAEQTAEAAETSQKVTLDLDIEISNDAERVGDTAVLAAGPATIPFRERALVEPAKVVLGAKVRFVPVFGVVVPTLGETEAT